MVFLLALSPILWLIVSLGVFKMPGFKACPLALVLAFAVALTEYQMAGLDAVTAALPWLAGLFYWSSLRRFLRIISPFIPRVWILSNIC